MPGNPDAILAQLDPEQRTVATSLGVPVAVVAGAGTGKTRAITHRIAYGALTGALDPRAVLAVTFTTRAAGELRSRLAGFGLNGVQARTFHSAALRQAQFFWPRAYGSALPEVTDARFALVAEAAAGLRLSTDTAVIRDLSAEISWAKVSNVVPDAYPAIARSANRLVSSIEPEQVARVMTTYDLALRERSRIDFDDILLCAVGLLADREDIAAQVRRQYRHFVVDEYQDVSPIQQRLVDLWLGPGHDVCVVGDPAQTIHTFAGASSQYLTGFASRHPGARTIELVRDYRSTPQVVSTANHVLRGSGDRHVTLRAHLGDGPAVEIAGSPTEASEAQQVAAWLRTVHEAGVGWCEMAVLYRINAQSPALELALSEQKIPYQVRNAERFYERPEVRQALAALTATARTEGELEGLPRVRAVLGALGWTQEAPQGGGRVRERWESQTALVDLAAEISEAVAGEAGGAVPDLEALVTELQQRASIEHAPAGVGVTLSTLHSAKGLEWEAVGMFGMHEGSLPFVLATTPEQISEERRLLYVGITRARRYLRISWSRSRSGQGADRLPSRFLDGLVPTAEVGGTGGAPKRRRERRQTVALTCRVCSRSLSTPADRVLGRHESCPSSYDEDLLAALKTWRLRTAQAARLPAFCIFTDATLIAIAESLPGSTDALSQISGVGPAKIRNYGDAVLALVAAGSLVEDTPE